MNVGFNSPEDLCEDEILVEQVLKNFGDDCLSDDLSVLILNESGTLVLDTEGIVDYDWVGRKLQYKVVDNGNGGSCWGYLDIEDKKKPLLPCDIEDPIDIYCYESISLYLKENFDVEDCDENVKIEQKSALRSINRCDGELSDEVLEEYKVTLVGIDSWGNKSDDCEIIFRILRINSLEDDVDYPGDFSKEENTAISCYFDIPPDEKGNGYPSPVLKNGIEGTGVPYIENIPLYPNNGQFCNLWVDYEDQQVKEGCKTRIIRTWIITETACTEDGPARRVEMPQVIDIIDDRGPSIQALPDMVLTTSSSICGRTLRLDPPFVSDTCNHGANLDLKIEGGLPAFFPDFKKGDEIVLDTGLNVLVFTATDECNNSNRDTVLITVNDLTPPTTVCITNTVVSLTEEGIAMAHASSFDNGSRDECYLKKFLVKRMDDGSGCNNEELDTDFDEYVHFCCADLGKTIMVVLRSYDKNHNMSECMVEVQVQDKIKPLIVCPPDISLSCGIDLSDLSDFGTVRMSQNDVEQFEIDPDYFIGSSGVLVDGFAMDNCDFTVMESVSYDLDNCGAGTILRKFVIKGGNGDRDSCTQTLTLEKNPLFFESMEVNWPPDTILYDCYDPEDEEISAEYLGSPVFEYEGCQMVGTTSKDEIYNFSGNGDGSCFKILRTWTIIDWCAQSSRGSDYLKKTDVQVIKIVDTIPPVIIGDFLPIDTCSYDPDCLSGAIHLSAAVGPDECFNNIIGYFEIDEDNNGSFDFKSGIFEGGIIDDTIDFAIGNHKVRYVFSDQCGNRSSVYQLITIVNCKEPTPYAYNGLVIDLMGMDTTGNGKFDLGMAEIWASDFDAGSSHPCNLPVILSFSQDTTDKSRTYFCDSVGMRNLELWATIVAENGALIQSRTTTTIDIQDNQKICAGINTFTLGIIGDISSYTAMPVSEAMVKLLGANMEYPTNQSGEYAFPPMPLGGHYEVIPYKNDDVLNGVNTLDLVKIQRHILGVKSFDSPYQYIAADINKDGSLSASDIIELRKLILGLNDGFLSNTSWRFIDKLYHIPHTESILEDGFPESYNILNLNSDMQIDFTGIKIGDVDGDHREPQLRNVMTRSSDQYVFNYPNHEINEGEISSLTLYCADHLEVLGLQLAIHINNNFNILSVESELFDVKSEDYHYDESRSILILSKAFKDKIDLTPGKIAIEIKFVADQNGVLSDFVSLSNNTAISSQIYDVHENTYRISLEKSNKIESANALHQNNPNPFFDYTDISFELIEEQSIELVIYDVAGRMVYQKYGDYHKGMNTIRINSEELISKGMLYYQIKGNDFFAARKMVAIR